MKKISLEELYEIYIQHPEISKDSREISKGCLYFALRGENFNGNKFAKPAIKNGAAYAIIDDPGFHSSDSQLILVDNVLETLQNLARLHRSKLSIPIIGITGSNGKTTTKELISKVLSTSYKTYATKGNYNNHIGVPLTILSINNQHEIAVIEMGANHQGEIAFLSSIADPDFGIITNIGKAHLEGFGGIEGIKKGKSELYKHLRKKKGAIFINNDDKVLLQLAKGLKSFGYGQSSNNYCSGKLNRTQPSIKGAWKCPQRGQKGVIKSELYGEYNFYNILAAICIGNHFEINSSKIDRAISHYHSSNNRSQLIVKDNYQVFLDAYNANPSSMRLALKDFDERQEKLKMVILGDMFELGEESEEEHSRIFELVKQYGFKKVVFVGKHFYKLKTDHENLVFFKETEEVRDWFKKLEKTGYQILIKGSRGMALEKVLQ